MSNRSKRAQIAQETVEILDRGHFLSPTGQTVDISVSVSDSVQGTVPLFPESFSEVFRQRDELLEMRSHASETQFIVKNTTTLAAARELLAENDAPVLCLNFASAKNPGGGFLSGSQAQEECLARASALYPSISSANDYYEINRKCDTSLYTDHMIYSPAVSVFRNDADELIEDPYRVSFLTAPAVNRGAVMANEAARLHEVEPTMLARMDKLLAYAVVRGYTRLVLGAWGCGVFRNDPGDVAKWFATHLNGNVYRGVFDTVFFAVLDHTEAESTVAAFQERFPDDVSID